MKQKVYGAMLEAIKDREITEAESLKEAINLLDPASVSVLAEDYGVEA